jgi:hypothetical protein
MPALYRAIVRRTGAAFVPAVLLAACTPPAVVPDPGPVAVTFHETDALFRNPGQGWMVHRRLPPAGEPRFPCSVAYFRLDWADLEPEEGKPDWRLLDEAIAAWKARGARVAFRVMTANAHSAGYFCSPRWLFDAGCRSFDYVRGGDDPTAGGKRIPRVEPDYADPLYLEKHGTFLRELGRRYDGHPGVEFLDIGSYGIWGEWHTPHPAPLEVRCRIVDRYLESFRKTPLVMMSDDAETLDHALSRGTGFRRDGVGSPWHEQNWIGSKKYAGVRGFADAWTRAPVVFEWYGDYRYLLGKDWSFDRAVQFMLDNHVTLVNDNVGEVPAAKLPELQKLARLAGYRFVLREVRHAGVADRGAALRVAMTWSNVGVGKLYRRHPLRLCLLDGPGAVAAEAEAEADARDWLPGDHAVVGVLPIPAALRPGTYGIAVALADPDTGKPAIALAIDAPETGRRYRVSEVTVR